MNCRLPTVSANTTLDKILLVVNKPWQVLNGIICQHLRSSCMVLGGKETFRYTATDMIGTRHLQCGTAQSPFLMNLSVHNTIMILERWSSDALLVYVRPQALEWTTNKSQDMMHMDSFFDVTVPDKAQPSDPRTWVQFLNAARNSNPTKMQTRVFECCGFFHCEFKMLEESIQSAALTCSRSETKTVHQKTWLVDPVTWRLALTLSGWLP